MLVLFRLFRTARSVFCAKLLHELREGETSAHQFELARSNVMSAPHCNNWKANETKWFNCGLGTDADSELNVNKTFNDKFHLASWVWPVAGYRDAYMMMLRHSAIFERKRLQS